MTRRGWLLSATIAGALLAAAPVAASEKPVETDDPRADVSLQAEAGVVSEYRFRGVSLSDRDPAAQGGIELTSGAATVGAWTSTITRTAGGSRQEIDLYLTLSKEIGQTAVSATALAYLYPSDRDANYVELALGMARTLGPIEVGLDLAYAPEQKNLSGEDNTYVALTGSVSTAIADLSASIGHESGAFAPGGKWDWSVTTSRQLGPFRLSLSYVDTDRHYRNLAGRSLSGGTIVAGLMLTFGQR